MKPRWFGLLLLSLLLLPVWTVAAAGVPVRVDFYFQPGCHDCEKVERLTLPQLADECPGQYELRRYDASRPDVLPELVKRLEKLGVNRNDTVSMIVADRVYLGGYDEIAAKLIPLVKAGGKTPEPVAPEGSPTPHHHHFVFTLSTVTVAGLLDGINPCVFSTLVFFLSLLAAARVSGRKLLLTGAVYCLACFLTYLALGFGLFRFLRLLESWHGLQLGLEFGMAAVLVILAGVSFADAWNYRRVRRSEAVRLQLPDRVKRLIHRIMRHNLTYRRLVPGALLTGMLVTLLEAVCTGQVYLPTLVLLTREASGPSVWLAYLLWYNLMFIVPLLVLFGCFSWGANLPLLLRWSKRNVTVSKTLLGMFFLVLAGTLAFLAFR